MVARPSGCALGLHPKRRRAEEAPGALARLPREVREQLVALRPSFPTWLAQQVSSYCHA